ncbi:predicted protein [Botrytis cinerea T4]|uniref:Uncharacterized protein n=1 Tax=Botryotinia fuckeliana (strain T4) TaxID=999810 RepID=G2YEL4_BOTF4|nr:predicted protein [Botrytis cinerea T4]
MRCTLQWLPFSHSVPFSGSRTGSSLGRPDLASLVSLVVKIMDAYGQPARAWAQIDTQHSSSSRFVMTMDATDCTVQLTALFISAHAMNHG